MDTIISIISNIDNALLSVFAILWAPACVAVFLFFVLFALWPSNRKKFFTTTKGRADESSNP
jgi:archaellum biogenesis protein FlaJ (TadC family)